MTQPGDWRGDDIPPMRRVHIDEVRTKRGRDPIDWAETVAIALVLLVDTWALRHGVQLVAGVVGGAGAVVVIVVAAALVTRLLRRRALRAMTTPPESTPGE